MLSQTQSELRRCTRCILPETMPYMVFDRDGVCNYCHNWRPDNAVAGDSGLLRALEPYRRSSGIECIVPVSGGRDSSYALYVAARVLGLRTLAFTYDWGMVTDVARANLRTMLTVTGVSSAVIDDSKRNREYIARNLRAWLKAPELGMLSVLTAADKHVFRYVRDLQRDNGGALVLWGTNNLETTHFKAGFLGVPPNFVDGVYSRGAMRQARYHWRRFLAMLRSPGYFNRSVPWHLYGEYYRSVASQPEQLNLFDYHAWNEEHILATLRPLGWAASAERPGSWRVGDGTMPFYNHVYHTVAGFTENDTFRSNQVRAGQLSRIAALELAARDNEPWPAGIHRYLELLGGFDCDAVLAAVDEMPKLWRKP